jgi:hypothetical protein
MRRSVLVLTVAVAMVLLAAGGVAVAAFTLRGDQLREVAVVQEANDRYTYSPSWRDIPGASVTFTNDTPQDELAVAQFNGQSLCHPQAPTNGAGGGHCLIRIVIEYPNGDQTPILNSNGSAFDSSANGDWEMHSMDRTGYVEGAPIGGSVTYTVKAQWRHSGATTVCAGDCAYFGLDDYSLIVERMRVK